MANKIKNQPIGGGSEDSFEGDALSQKELSEACKGGNPRDISSFSDILSRKGENHSEGDSLFGGNRESGSTNFAEWKSSPDGQRFVPNETGNVGDMPWSVGDVPRSTGDGVFHRNGGFVQREKNDNISSASEKIRPAEGSNQAGKLERPIKTGNKLPHGVPVKENAESDSPDEITDDKVTDTSVLSGNRILDSIQSQHIGPSAAEAANVIKNLASEVAEKIIATREALNAGQEVRITIQDGILKDTDVIITKDGKTLIVNFVTGSDESANILSHRGGELRTQLMEKLSDVDNITVEVEHSESTDDQSGDDGSRRHHDGQEQGDDNGDEFQ
jgi:hypothetical protein